MSSADGRLERVRLSLTPRQAVLAWMEEAHRAGSLQKSLLSIKDQPPQEMPLARLPSQVSMAVRRTMQGEQRERVEEAAHQAVRDTLFLYHLHLGVNVRVVEDLERLRQTEMTLLQDLLGLLRLRAFNDQVLSVWQYVGSETAYPVDTATEAAWEAACDHYVETWEQLEQADTIEGWVTKQYVREGGTELPFGAYLARDDERVPPFMALPSEQELRGFFPDESAYDDFASGRDFTSGLSTVRDADFAERHEAVQSALHELVAGGEVNEGRAVRLESVPIELLRDAPLVDSEWIDRHVLELAEQGALLHRKRLVRKPPDDDHPLACDRFFTRSGEEVDEQVLVEALAEAREHLTSLKGRTRELGGQQQISFADYCRWRGRRVKGKLTANIQTGIVAASWNRWIGRSGGEGEAELAGVRVGRFAHYAEQSAFVACNDAPERQRRRKQLLTGLRRWMLNDFERPDSLWCRPLPFGGATFRDHVVDWSDRAAAALLELYALSAAVDAINADRFEGRDALYPASRGALATQIASYERAAEIFNDEFVTDFERQRELVGHIADPSGSENDEEADVLMRLEPDTIQEPAPRRARQLARYVADMAKAEAFAGVGQHSDARAAIVPHLPEA